MFVAIAPSPVPTVPLRRFFKKATKIIEIPCAKNLFRPDDWTTTFARGLEILAGKKNGLFGKSVLEVGVGTGVNMAGLLMSKRPVANYVGVDLCPHAIKASLRLANKHDWSVTLRESDLLSDIDAETLESVHHVVACIPQVPADIDLSKADNAAHYYVPTPITIKKTGINWDDYGLGLNEKLLQQASDRAPQARVTLNLAGRPGLSRLKNLFNQFGYGDPEITYETMVPQHAKTSLASLANLEVPGHDPFEFYADVHGQEKLTATQAEQLRLIEVPIFHKIYVLTGPALSQ